MALAVLAAGSAALFALGPGLSGASSHREAPMIAFDPAADNTDLYAFVSPDRPGYVTFIANWVPFEEPDGGPNFYPFATDATYNIKVDADGDAKPDAEFRWRFQNIDKRGNNTFLYNNGPVMSLDDENLLFRQTYTLESKFAGDSGFKVRGQNLSVAPSRVGQASMPDYAKLRNDATITLPGGWRVFAGQSDDPFFLDLRVFDLLYGGDLTEVGIDTLKGFNVNTIALEVPFKDVALKGDATRNPVIGVWTTTDRPRVRNSGATGQPNGDMVQVSRLGQPLVNEVVIPAGLKDAFNSLSPDKDATIPAVVDRVKNPEVPRLIEAIYKVPAPPTPRDDLVEIFLTGITTKANGPIKADLNSQLNNMDVNPQKFQPSEMLRLNLSTPQATQPNRLGVIAGDLQGFPNGRRLSDDVVDIALQAVEGAAQSGKLVDALAKGDAVDQNDNAFNNTFPFVALPNTTRGVANANSNPNPGPTATPSVAPASQSMGDMMTNPAVIGSVTGGMGLLFFLGWWMRRQAKHRARR
ncbi:MAG TPA: DUF4331 domain-containing protein [Candidatus Limnocylindrales bacterium]|nr:DUF4331 domain-containing protein [Candidatus Limnocylindrales bacterium]